MEVSIPNKHKDFFHNVYDVVRLIPKGRVTSYGAIAKYLGSPRSSRMVGWAMNAAHNFSDVPAHRVVNRNGMLTGKMHFSSSTEMEKLLSKEGVSVSNDKIEKLNSVYWDPTHELEL
ncbi:MAG TPA: MGMT family protein [Crocinitomicaceae bacterium]|nr:MGMT family protein [Crocinitomicaceae bacterium]